MIATILSVVASMGGMASAQYQIYNANRVQVVFRSPRRCGDVRALLRLAPPPTANLIVDCGTGNDRREIFIVRATGLANVQPFVGWLRERPEVATALLLVQKKIEMH